MSSKPVIKSNVAIIGGGITGLWLQNRLAQQGYQSVLCEARALGGGQTLASQGMIHGGIKYALGGLLTDASEIIAQMPGRWSACLAGQGELDLSQVRVLSKSCYLWSNQALGRLASLFASKLVRGRVAAVPRSAFPPFFDHPAFNGSLYRLHEPVLDTTSLLKVLATPFRNRILLSEVRPENLVRNPDGGVQRVQLDACDIEAETYIFAAGTGNEALLDGLLPSTNPLPSMQRRPLQQVMVNLQNVPGMQNPDQALIYGHYVAGLDAQGPRLTLTSHGIDTGAGAGRSGAIWYVGGQLASEGATRAPLDQIGRAREELARALPWIDLRGAEYQTYRVDRAEPSVAPAHLPRATNHTPPGTRKNPEPRPSAGRSLHRPEDAWVSRHANVLLCWPTKLTLIPRLGDRVMAEMSQTAKGPKRSETSGQGFLASAQPARQAVHQVAHQAVHQAVQADFATPPWAGLHDHA